MMYVRLVCFEVGIYVGLEPFVLGRTFKESSLHHTQLVKMASESSTNNVSGSKVRSIIGKMKPNWFSGELPKENPVLAAGYCDEDDVVERGAAATDESGDSDQEDVIVTNNFSVMESLFERGSAFEHILEIIFMNLDGNSLTSAAAVCQKWQRFIDRRLFSRSEVINKSLPLTLSSLWLFSQVIRVLNDQWSSYLPQFYIKFHRSKVVSMCCDAVHIVVGEEWTGKAAVYRRKEITRRRYRRLEHELGAGVPTKVFDAVKPRFTIKVTRRTSYFIRTIYTYLSATYIPGASEVRKRHGHERQLFGDGIVGRRRQGVEHGLGRMGDHPAEGQSQSQCN